MFLTNGTRDFNRKAQKGKEEFSPFPSSMPTTSQQLLTCWFAEPASHIVLETSANCNADKPQVMLYQQGCNGEYNVRKTPQNVFGYWLSCRQATHMKYTHSSRDFITRTASTRGTSNHIRAHSTSSKQHREKTKKTAQPNQTKPK